jgi:hypothetical protein
VPVQVPDPHLLLQDLKLRSQLKLLGKL